MPRHPEGHLLGSAIGSLGTCVLCSVSLTKTYKINAQLDDNSVTVRGTIAIGSAKYQNVT